MEGIEIQKLKPFDCNSKFKIIQLIDIERFNFLIEENIVMWNLSGILEPLRNLAENYNELTVFLQTVLAIHLHPDKTEA